jgi:hypothetical protein
MKLTNKFFKEFLPKRSEELRSMYFFKKLRGCPREAEGVY